MASPAIRARIAPIALVIALGFVIVGFLRADHEMTRAESDRARLVLAESATLVEAFVLRQLVQLHSIQQLIVDHQLNIAWIADSLPIAVAQSPGTATGFDHIWLADSTLQIRASIGLHGRSDEAIPGHHVMELLQTLQSSTPQVAIEVQPDRRSVVFVEWLRHPAQAIIAAVPSDSLRVLLEHQHRPGPFRIVVTASADTVTFISTLQPNNKTKTLVQSVSVSLAYPWVVTMMYVPTGRGVRIALWVVGLGAIIGLGIGLVLERREASRIADRSSELEHLSTELLRANRAKSEFLANVSHELRTPLNAIVGFVDLLRDGVYGPLNARQSGPVERIEASANHLRHLVDQVLDLAKMAAGRLEVHTEPIELRPFVFDVVSEVEPLMSEKGLSFSLAVGVSLPRVRTDPTHLRQILINLLGNAVKFTSDGGISIRGRLVRRNDETSDVAPQSAGQDRQSISPKAERPWVALQVADSGIGIPAKDCERIFDEFEQVNAGPRGDSMRRGTGLGLSISRRLARLLGGDITVESELGRGSVFTVWLPVDPADLREHQAA
jgi:signal transduction histidine kinase